MSFFGASSPKGTRRAPVQVASRGYVRRLYDWVSAEERAPLVSAALKVTGFVAACAFIRARGAQWFAPEPMLDGSFKDPFGGTYQGAAAWEAQKQIWMEEQANKASLRLPETI